jgi:phosphoribosyl 1,2-cyclic phosphate phosphodiesterase
LTLRLTILGCGSSGGVPRIGEGWGACDPANPKNRRRRCSVLVERLGPAGTTAVLVDTSPDLREQLLDAGVKRLDAVLLSHPHADHTHGIDDLRPLCLIMRRRLDVYMNEVTSLRVTDAFSYIFQTPDGSSYPPIAAERRLTTGQVCRVQGPGGAVETMPFDLDHGDISALGFRFGGLAYTPDVISIPDASRAFLEDLDVWIIDALRYRPHPSHFSLDEALSWIEKMRPRRAILTNLHTDLDYETLRAKLPGNVTPAYDGMRVEGFETSLAEKGAMR